MKKLLLPILTLFISCSSAENSGEKDYRVVDISSMQQEETEIDKLFDNKKYIVLDDSKNFYPARIKNVLVRGDRLYIYSYMRRNSQLLVFDLDGNPVMSVGAIGKAENEFLGIDGYDVAPNGDIYINDLLSKKLLTYDKDGKFKKSNRDMPTDLYSMALIEDGKYLFGLTPWNVTEGKQDLVLLDNNIQTPISYYRENVDSNYLIVSASFTKNGDDIFYHNDLNDTLYCVDKVGGLKEKIFFDFGSRQVPEKDKIDLEQKIDNDKLFEKYTTLARFCCEDENYIYGGLYDAMEHKIFIVDKAKNTLYSSKNSTSEPLGEVTGFDGKYLISSIDYTAYSENKDYYPESVAKALKEEKSVICLMYND